MGRPKGSRNKCPSNYDWLIERLAQPFTNDCVKWPFFTRPNDGYCQVYVPNEGAKLVHRVVLTLMKGDCPEGFEGLHECDNKTCINPDHLKWGTHKENLKGSYERGLSYPLTGGNGPGVKIREIDVKYIFGLDSLGYSATKIAEEFPIGKTQISSILNGDKWSYLGLKRSRQPFQGLPERKRKENGQYAS